MQQCADFTQEGYFSQHEQDHFWFLFVFPSVFIFSFNREPSRGSRGMWGSDGLHNWETFRDSSNRATVHHGVQFLNACANVVAKVDANYFAHTEILLSHGVS